MFVEETMTFYLPGDVSFLGNLHVKNVRALMTQEIVPAVRMRSTKSR